jgi:hypothetical protein
VTQLVAQQDAQLVVVQQGKRGGVDHDEGLVHAESARVHERRLRHEQVGPFAPIHRRQHFRVQGVQARELGGADAHRIGLEEQADAALAQHPHDLAHHLVEAGDGPQRLEGGAVGRVLPGDGRDLGQDLAGPGGRKGGISHGRTSVMSE